MRKENDKGDVTIYAGKRVFMLVQMVIYIYMDTKNVVVNIAAEKANAMFILESKEIMLFFMLQRNIRVLLK